MNKFLLPTLLLSATALSISPNQAQSVNKTPIQQIFSWTNISQALFTDILHHSQQG